MLIDEKNPLIFMHIPKTGGMSLFTAFCKLWGTRIADLYNVTTANPRPAADAIRARDKCLYCGHFPFGLHEWFDRPVYYASVLRQPVERVVSLYHYVQPMLAGVRRTMADKGLSAEQVFAGGKVADYYHDFLPWIEGEQTVEAFFSCPSADLDNGMVRRFSGVGLAPGRCPPEALERSKENIEKCFSVVGRLDRYGDTLTLLERKLGLPGLPENRVNVNARKPKSSELSPALKERIEAMNALDLALYDWVGQRFDEELADPSPPIKVPGGRRKDFQNVSLWLAVGNSPLRDAAMEARGVPARPQPLVRHYYS
jgi:hypothetical protein